MATVRVRARRRFMEWLRHFNKWITNPLTRTFAGRRVYTLVRHVGRRSGRAYATPVLAERLGDGYVIPLPYGDHVDWYQNVLAAGWCEIKRQGKSFRVKPVGVLTAEEALPAFPALTRRLLRRNDVDQFLKVRPLEE